MVTLPHESTYRQTHEQGPKIQEKWLPSTDMMHAGEGTWKSDLWKLYRNGFTWSPYSMRGHIHRHTNRAPKFMISGSPAHI